MAGGVKEELAVAVAARNGAGQPALHAQAACRASLAQALLDQGIQAPVAHDAAFADVLRLQLKLRLGQHERVAAGAHQRRQRGQHQREGDEGQIARHQIKKRSGFRGV